jgi:Ca-activated chloride channel homolog
MIRFLQPWWLLATLPVAGMFAGYLWRQRHRRLQALRFSTTAMLRQIAPDGLGRRRHLAPAAFLLGLLALSGALARPAMEVPEPVERSVVMLAIDVSLSMEADDVEPTRLVAAQRAAVRFVEELPEDHLLGVVSFAATANVLVPPGTDREAAVRAIEGLTLAEATATGEAVFTSLEAIRSVPDDGAAEPAPARILLLTDGYRTYGRSTEEAGAAAADEGVPVHTVAFGTDHGQVRIGGQLHRVPVDRVAMARLAELTGGRFYEAASARELTAVYEDMGRAVGFRTVAREVTQWWLAGALLLGLVAGGLSLRWTPRLP